MIKLSVLKNYCLKKSEYIIFWGILVIAALTRLVLLNRIPDGLNQDEAFAAYESLSLFTTGRDTAGDFLSIYPPTWGQGMSPLYSWLTIPFFWIFGISTLSVRLPQALFGILSCILFFRLVTLMYNKRAGYIAFFLSAIMPWHIMMSRYGIEVNLAPFFILAGFYFFIKSYQHIPYLLLSAFFYGLGIYAFDCCAIYIACSFGFQLFCRLWCNFGKKTFLFILLSGFLFSLIAFPFILLVAVNNDLIPEIKSFITIPKMHYWKQENISFSGFFQKLDALWDILYTGYDNSIQRSIKRYEMFYPISLPFIIVGIYTVIHNICLETKNKRNNIILLGTLITGILYAGLIKNINIDRGNFLWFNLILCMAIGIDYLFIKKKDIIFIICLYLCFFVLFCRFYFTQYGTISQDHFSSGLEKSLSVALKEHKKSGRLIQVLSYPEVYPKILFWNQVKPQVFRETVKWNNPNAKFLHANSFSFYRIKRRINKDEITLDSIYIVPRNIKDFFATDKFDIKKFGGFIVAVPKKKK